MSAPRIPNDIKFWRNKGKTGKDVAIFFHDDFDGLMSAVIMKLYLEAHGYTIKQAGVINYQQSWAAFNLDKSLINIAVDFSEDHPDVDIYIDHHGVFEPEIALKQKRYAVKTISRIENGTKISYPSGSAAYAVAFHLGLPVTQEMIWIDMIDTANYSGYGIDVTTILDMDWDKIKKTKNPKLSFAACFNQEIKRGDYQTLLEVFKAAKSTSLYQFYRLFKLFYPYNNIHYRTGENIDFKISAENRMRQVKNRGRGQKDNDPNSIFDEKGKLNPSYNIDSRGQITKRVITSPTEMHHLFNAEVTENKYKPIDPDNPETGKFKISPRGYQIIGNLVFVPSGTWLNPIRIKSLVTKDRKLGIIKKGLQLNYVFLQYGNTIQITDFDVRLDKIDPNQLIKTNDNYIINHLGDYMIFVVKQFRGKPDYKEERTYCGGHKGIGTISNIFGICQKGRITSLKVNMKYLDLMKNKVIRDLSGLPKWSMSFIWNDFMDSKAATDEAVNTRLKNTEDLRNECDTFIQKEELEMTNFIYNTRRNIDRKHLMGPLKKNFKFYGKLYDLVMDLGLGILDDVSPEILTKIRFWNRSEQKYLYQLSKFVSKVVSKYDFSEIFLDKKDRTTLQKKQRKEIKNLLRIMFNIKNNAYITETTVFDKKKNAYVIETTRDRYHRWKPVRPSKRKKIDGKKKPIRQKISVS